jgi:hypothetical protein
MSGWRNSAIFLVLTMWGTAPVQASTFHAYGGIGFQADSTFLSLGDNYDRTGFLTTGGQVNFDDAGVTFPGISLHDQADSLGGPGFLRAHTFAQMIHSNEDPTDHSLSSSSNSTIIDDFTDMTVFGLPGSILTRLAFHLDGFFITGTTFVPGRSTTAQNSVSIGLTINGQDGGHGSFYWVSQNGNPPAQFLSTGLLTNFTGNLDFLSSFVSVPTNQPFEVIMTLQTEAGVNGPTNHGVILDANSNFSSTFSFATDRPVFDFQTAGYNANSVDANIVNNRFTLVPEPTALPILLPALMLVGHAGRMRQTRNVRAALT